MVKIGLIRCEKNEKTCPLTSCLKSLKTSADGFSVHGDAELAGVFTCRCPGDGLVEMAKIMKSKGAEAIYFCTCLFAHKENSKWINGSGFCKNIDALMEQTATESGLPCIKGTAHLPDNYNVEIIQGNIKGFDHAR